MRRLNVRSAQIDTCIEYSLFAVSNRPVNPELAPGELMLLQLVKQEARQKGKLRSRIDFALVFDRIERDYDGTISRHFWPREHRVWDWIIYGSATVPTVPLSLEDLGLSRDYDGQDNARLLDESDAQAVESFVLWSLAQPPKPELQKVPIHLVHSQFGNDQMLLAIYNHDRIVHTTAKARQRAVSESGERYLAQLISPVDPELDLITELRYERNPWLATNLKSYYNFRCQVCGNDFEPRFGTAYAESHHIQYLSQGGPDASDNMVVLCPNHHRVIHSTGASFDVRTLTYAYPNGLREPLLLPDHLVNHPRLSRPAT